MPLLKTFNGLKKNISKIDDELNKLAKTVKSNIDIKSIEKMLQ